MRKLTSEGELWLGTELYHDATVRVSMMGIGEGWDGMMVVVY